MATNLKPKAKPSLSAVMSPIIEDLPSERFQHLLTQYKSLSKQKGFYTSYFDTGLFGNYFECQPDRLEDAINVTNQSFKSNDSSLM